MEKSFIIDNSIVMSWCFKEQTNPLADTILGWLQEASAYVPSVWPLEVVNVLIAAERKALISKSDSIRFLRLLSQLPIRVQHESTEGLMKDTLGLARDHNLSSYDASYLDLAMKKGVPLATLDKKLRKAAKSVNVELA